MTTTNGHHVTAPHDDDGADLPPHNPLAERALLGAMLLSTDAIRTTLDTTTVDDLYRPAHQAIYTSITALHRRGDTADPITVAAHLDQRGELIRSGGAPYLLQLIQDVPTAANAGYYAEIVADTATRRRLTEAGQRLQQLARETSHPVEDLLARARHTLDRTGPATAGPRARLVEGGSFILDASPEVPAIWGADGEVLWAEDEALIITGPTGVGKTTLAGQIVEARLGLTEQVLGFDITPGRRLLYLAMDRPAQIARALRRRLGHHDRELLDEHLAVWKGPPPADLARNPARLRELALEAGADTVVIDSLKDAAIKLTDEETGQGLNTAMQLCLADGIQVLALHHQKKASASGTGKPNSLADVYGSAWITAGAGSVLLLWGSAGDPVIELSHLKQPGAEVGPLRLIHDHDAGTTRVHDAASIPDLLAWGPRTTRELALELYGDGETPVSESQVEKTRRRVERMVTGGTVLRLEPDPDDDAAKPGRPAHRYALATRDQLRTRGQLSIVGD